MQKFRASERAASKPKVLGIYSRDGSGFNAALSDMNLALARLNASVETNTTYLSSNEVLERIKAVKRSKVPRA